MNERKKQIEEMALDIMKVSSLPLEISGAIATDLVELGYRKQVKAEWIYQEYSMGHYIGKCSNCECEADMSKYCPNCGAKMKGAE